MIVVETSALRFEEEGASAAGDFHAEHLMERVSALENHVARIIERVGQGLDLLLRQTRSSYLDHVLIETLLDVLDEAGSLDRTDVLRLWQERCSRDADETERGSQLSVARARVLGGDCATAAKEVFSRLVKEGFAQVGRGKDTTGVRTLERAAALAPKNTALNLFLGEHFFGKGKRALARDYLERAVSVERAEPKACLLLGVVIGDEGDAGRAADLLSRAVEAGGANFAASFALGRLSAVAGKFKEALTLFKQAHAARTSPETHYVVGFVNYRLGRYRVAARHVNEAAALDPRYVEALYLLGVTRLRLGESAGAAQVFKAAHALNRSEPFYRRLARRGRLNADDLPEPDPFGVSGKTQKRLLTGGDERLAALLKEQALSWSPAR